MVSIQKVAGAILDGIQNATETVYLNLFLDTITDPALRELESFLHINTAGKKLEERRKAIKPYFAGFGKISGKSLENMIFSYTGAGSNIELKQCDEMGNHGLFAAFERGEKELIDIDEMLNHLIKKKPAHIALITQLTYVPKSTIAIKTCCHHSYSEFIKIKPYFEGKLNGQTTSIRTSSSTKLANLLKVIL